MGEISQPTSLREILDDGEPHRFVMGGVPGRWWEVYVDGRLVSRRDEASPDEAVAQDATGRPGLGEGMGETL